MSCSAEEIAKKREEALKRLQTRRSNENASTSSFYGTSPNKYPSSSTSLNSTPTAAHQNQTDSNYVNKMKTNPYENHRIFSQPYPRNAQVNNNNSAEKAKSIAPIFRQTLRCECSLSSDTRFLLTISVYHKALVDVLKTIPSKNYDPQTRNWTFNLTDYNLVIEKMLQMRPDVIIDETIPPSVLKILKEQKPVADETCLNSLHPDLLLTLMPFQREGVTFGVQKKGRCMIADEMGLGKTYQALGIADFYKDDFPMLICTTATTRDVWMSKVRLLLPYIPCHYIVCLTTATDYFGEAKVLVVSYALLEKHINKILAKNFGVAIMDESHTLKNFKAKCTVAATEIAKRARRLILLTGTPALSRPVELFTQLKMIDPKFMSYKEYTRRYCDGRESNFGWDASGESNLTELNIILAKKFMIRRIKSDVLAELAEKNRETVMLDPSLIGLSDSDNSFEDDMDHLTQLATRISTSRGRQREDLLLIYYSETAKYKTRAVCNYVKDLIKEKKKFLIFAHHTVMMNAISNCLQQLNVDYIRIDGSTKNEVRTANVYHFQNDKRCLVAVLSIKACNTGITLTAAQLVVFAELDWNPTSLTQAESRAHRIGQEGTVTVRYLLAENTADDIIWPMLKSKQKVLKEAGLCDENFSQATNIEPPISESNTIESYFTPNKCEKNSNNNSSSMSVSNPLMIDTEPTPSTSTATNDNLLALLMDDDDDGFADLNF